MNTKVIFIIYLFLGKLLIKKTGSSITGLRIGTAVIGAPASKDLPGELAVPNNTVESLPASLTIHPILGRLHKIPQYLRRLRIDVEKELQGKIEPKLSIWPPFFSVSVEQPKTRDTEVNPQNLIEDVKPSPSVENLKLMRILIEHICRWTRLIT